MKPKNIVITDAQLSEIARVMAHHFAADESNENSVRIDVRAVEHALNDAQVNWIPEAWIENASIITQQPTEVSA